MVAPIFRVTLHAAMKSGLKAVMLALQKSLYAQPRMFVTLHAAMKSGLKEWLSDESDNDYFKRSCYTPCRDEKRTESCARTSFCKAG